jgi:tetratricopeptide (TPR) repeat protein
MGGQVRNPRVLVAESVGADSLPRAPSELLLSSYRDLGDIALAPQHARSVVLAYDEYRRGITAMHLRRHPMGTIRLLLQGEWSQEHVGPYHPRQIALGQRSARWGHLCDGLDAFHGAGLEEQAALLGLCSALGYFGLTVDLGLNLARGFPTGKRGFADGHSRLFLLVAGSVARMMPAEAGRPLLEQLLGAIRERGTRNMRLLARANHVAYLSWSGTPAEGISGANALARELGEYKSADSPEEALASVLGMLACGWAFARNGDTAQGREQVDEAWERIREQDSEHDVTTAHVVRSVIEARVALCVLAGDPEKAIEEHGPIVDADPLDAQACAERGALLEAIDVKKALAWYRQAVRLGAPLAEYVSERIGDVLMRAGDLVGAYDAYASAAASGNSRGCALLKLAQSAEKIGQLQIAGWAAEQLAVHAARQTDQNPEPLPIGASLGTFPPSPVLELAVRELNRVEI